MSVADRFISLVTDRSALVVVVLVLVSLVMGAGMSQLDEEAGLDQFQFDSEEGDALTYIEENFEPDDDRTTTVQIVLRGEENVLTRESLLSTLELQAEIRDDPELERPLADDPFADLANVVATTAIQQDRAAESDEEQGALDAGESSSTDAGRPSSTDPGESSSTDPGESSSTDPGESSSTGPGESPSTDPGEDSPTLDEQRDQLESMTDDEVEAVVGTVLGESASRGVLSFVPLDFEPGTTETDARQLFVTQTTEEEIVEGEAPAEIVDSQLAIAELVEERFGDDAFVFGAGIISDEIDRSMADSLAIVLPLSLLFVVVVLSVAYRDPLDIVLGVVGIGLVLVWTFGFMGWTGIAFNQIMIAVPVLLVGLSIDYAIHVFMRHREQRTDREISGNSAPDTRPAMRTVLFGLGAALVWVTVTAVIGFLSNLVSPVAPIREFGLVSAFGIAATLVIFVTFVPAAKVGLDAALEARGWDRRKRAFGTGGGAFTRLLSGGQTLARRAPAVVVVVVLVLTAAGVVGATQVDTTFEQEDFIADSPPAWMSSLPGSLAPGEYSVKSNLEFVNERFLRQDASTQVLVRGDVTSDSTLQDVDAATEVAVEGGVVVTLADGEADIRSALSVMEDVAAENETFAATFEAADTSGDGVPDEDVTAVYDAFFEAAPERASDVIYRTDGEYEATRLALSIRGDASASEAADGTRDVAAVLDRAERPAIATGQLVVFNVIEDELFNTVIESLLLTMVAVFAFLMVAYRLVHGSAMLGAITLTPILLTVAWILGTMYLLGVSFNVLTGTITSLTIGLGVAYNIHMSERYRLELRRGYDVWDALDRAVAGTGGALLGSAATTAGGFGVLALAILPPLQQFGIITGLTIIYAFLASVFVLPTFLVLWTRYLGPADQFPDPETSEAAGDAPAGPGGALSAETGTAGTSGTAGTTGHRTGGPSPTVTEFDPPTDGRLGSLSPNGDPTAGLAAGRSRPLRSVTPPVVEPGWPYTVSLSVPLSPGRTALREQFPGKFERGDVTGPPPIDAVERDGQLYVAWELDEPATATVRYVAVALERTLEGTLVGTVTTPTGEQAVGGEASVTVVADVAAADGGVDNVLEAAGHGLRKRQLTTAEYERVLEEWLESRR